jgi:hypothetical protein
MDRIGLLSELLDVYSETFPISGMTRNGLAFERPTPARRMDGSVSSFLPTPRTSDTNGAGQHGDCGPDLRTVVSLLPTPGVADATGGHERRGGERSNELLLKGVVKTLLPTPDASAANSGEHPDTWLVRRERVKATAKNGNGMGMPLSIAAQLIGEPTSPRSDGGNEPLDV